LAEPDPATFVKAVRQVGSELARGRNPLDDGGLMSLVATPRQREGLDRIQALMSLLEGHGNFVMDELGSRHVAGAERMSAVLHARRRSPGVAGFMHKVLGFESKMRQYEVGERFVRGVVERAGHAALAYAWRNPESLPTLTELAAPQHWLMRVESADVSLSMERR